MRPGRRSRRRAAGAQERGLVATRPGVVAAGPDRAGVPPRADPRGRLPVDPASRSGAPRTPASGDWIAALAGDRREEFVDLLAHHYERAVDKDRRGDARRRRSPRCSRPATAPAAGPRPTTPCCSPTARWRSPAAPAEWLAALELKARALHAAVRADESLAAYQAALDLARGEDAERLRAHATLLCARYPGPSRAPSGGNGRSRRSTQGLAGDAEQRDTFEVGALLVGRASMVRWFVLEGDELAKARRAAERAIEIAERIGSTQLLSHGLEALGWRDADHGFCDASATADRMLEVVRRMPDRVEASESLVIAAICLARGGRFEDAFAAGREAAASARHLSPHRRMHAASAQTVCLLGAGRLRRAGRSQRRSARAR